MHIYFSGIGGAGIGPLALLAHEAGYDVSGSDIKDSQYSKYLVKKGINLHIGQEEEVIANEHANNPIDWVVFSSAVLIENPKHPELVFAHKNKIKVSKRDECLNYIISNKKLKLIAAAGTHGKTSTTALAIWIMQELGKKVSYSVGAKTSFCSLGHYDEDSEYFVYECDEFDRNFLNFNPYVSIITSIDWDHHEIYPTPDDYKQAFRQFIDQSKITYILQKDAKYINCEDKINVKVIDKTSSEINDIKLFGLHNRQNGLVTLKAIQNITGASSDILLDIVSRFPGTSRRFEKIADGLYSDYAHTPEEIEATLQMVSEINNNYIVVYEPLTNRRQHYMKTQYKNVFDRAKYVYWLPSYLTREDPKQKILAPKDLIEFLDAPSKDKTEPAEKNSKLIKTIRNHLKNGDLVLCLAGGGGGSLDEWIRLKFKEKVNV
jgi:UDP-N-acetylmuramate--alanine ligase